MVLLKDILDADLLTEHIANGLVSARRHESLPLEIFNYTPEAAYSRHWDDVTKKCRGLIWNYETGEVVARPFEKFFNWDEAGSPFPPSGPALRMEKADGSLGILYWDESDPNESKPCIATRGSFHSEQAEWATEEIRNYFPGEFEPLDGKTYLFEIIYPENRIVVDYGDYEGLMLLDVIDNETGFADTDEFDNCNWDDKVVREMVPGFDSGQAVDIADGEEGFVYLWPARNFRTKMKSAEYIRIHRLVSSLSEKSVWESLVAGKTLDEMKIGLPEEFHKFIDDTYDDIVGKATAIMSKVYTEFGYLVEGGYTEDRKKFAHAVKENSLKKYLFLLLDGKGIYPVALHASKPTKAKALVTEE